MNKRSQAKKILTLVVLIVTIMAAMTFAVSSGQKAEIQTVTSGLSLPANSVSSELNVSLSHLSYTTQPPQFMVNSTNYALNATYTAGSQFVTNATYQIFQYNASVATATASVLSYDFAYYVASSPTEFFSDSKIGFNGTMTSPGLQVVFGNASQTAVVSTTSMKDTSSANTSIAQEFWIDLNATTSGSSDTYNASFGYWYLSGTSYVVNYSKLSGTPLQALNMYELQVNIQTGYQQVSIVYTNNGTVAQSIAVAPTNSNATKTPMLNFNHIGHASYIFTPTASASGGFLFDWMYVVDTNTIAYNQAFTPNIAASTAYIPSLSSKLSVPPPRLPPSNFQSANATASATQVKVSNDLISNVENVTNSTPLQNAIGMNNTLTTPYTAGMSGSNVLANTVFSNVSNATTTVNEQAQSWNSQYIKSVLVTFLKDYAAAQAEKQFNVFVSPNDITLTSFRIGSIFVDTNYSSSAATAIRDYLDNTYASILAANNLSLVNPATSAIVAGAAAGEFYDNGIAVYPIIHGNNIINPITNQVYTIQSAGFAAGTYISGGTVIVPQYKLVGWYEGSPLFAVTSGSSLFGSIFSSLTSAGHAISNLAESAASTITNGIGTVANVVDNNIVKPIDTGPVVKTVESDVSNLVSSAVGVTGTINKDVQGAIKAGNTLVSGAVNTVSGDLQSTASDASSAIMAGYNGVKSGIYSIGATVQSGIKDAGNGLNQAGSALLNTAGKVVSTATDAVSTLYTSAKNFISGSASNLYNTVSGVAKNAYDTLSSIGNTFVKTTTGAYNAVTSTLGGIASSIVHGVKSVFSVFAGVPAMISHFLVYVGIIAIVVVGIVLVIFFLGRRTPGGNLGARNI